MAFLLLDTRRVHIPRKSSRSFFSARWRFSEREAIDDRGGRKGGAAVGQTNKRRLAASRDRPIPHSLREPATFRPRDRDKKKGGEKKKKKNRHPKVVRRCQRRAGNL